MGGWVYIMTNKREGVLYIGVTSDLVARMAQHRSGKGSRFCRRYGLDRLVYTEAHDDIRVAISREKALKAWKRAWKIELIECQSGLARSLRRHSGLRPIPAFAGMTIRGRIDLLLGLGASCPVSALGAEKQSFS